MLSKKNDESLEFKERVLDFGKNGKLVQNRKPLFVTSTVIVAVLATIGMNSNNQVRANEEGGKVSDSIALTSEKSLSSGESFQEKPNEAEMSDVSEMTSVEKMEEKSTTEMAMETHQAIKISEEEIELQDNNEVFTTLEEKESSNNTNENIKETDTSIHEVLEIEKNEANTEVNPTKESMGSIIEDNSNRQTNSDSNGINTEVGSQPIVKDTHDVNHLLNVKATANDFENGTTFTADKAVDGKKRYSLGNQCKCRKPYLAFNP